MTMQFKVLYINYTSHIRAFLSILLPELTFIYSTDIPDHPPTRITSYEVNCDHKQI